MYPGEGMYIDEPLHHHHHHLPVVDGDDGDNNDHHHDDHGHEDHDHSSDTSHHRHHQNQHKHKHKHKHHPNGNTPPPHHHHHHSTPPKHSPSPSLRLQQPLQPPTPLIPPTPILPQPPLQPPTLQPPLQPPILLQPPPQQPSSQPPPPPRKPQPPPLDLNHPHHYNDPDDDDDKHKSPHHQIIGATIFIVLLLLGLTFLILWLIYRPSEPHFTAISTLIYTLNTTTDAAATMSSPGATVAASMQFIIHTTNPNKRTTLSYDHLTATVYYHSTAITPPVPLPPLFHRKHSSVIISPVIGGPPPAVEVPVEWEVANGLLSEEAYGVVGFSWVVVGRVRYRVGGFKSGHSRVYVKCDVVVRLTGVNNGVYVNSGGQVPLLASPPCLVDI